MADIQFIGDQGGQPPEEVDSEGNSTQGGVTAVADGNEDAYPAPILPISKETEARLKAHISEWLTSLQQSHTDKVKEWADQEAGYRAISDGPKNTPFVGACGDVVPVIAMAVDPVHARLDTGIFKAKPVFKLTGLKKSILPVHRRARTVDRVLPEAPAALPAVCSPRILEMTKHGTMIYKTVYERETLQDQGLRSQVEGRRQGRHHLRRTEDLRDQHSGPALPPDTSISTTVPSWRSVRTTYGNLKIAEASNKLKNVEKLADQEVSTSGCPERERKSAQIMKTRHADE
jgi:hypothetical protein